MRIVAVLSREFSKHGLRVTPVVAELVGNPLCDEDLICEAPAVDPFRDTRPFPTLLPNAGEVDALFSAPLSLFLRAEHHAATDIEWRGLPLRLHAFSHTPGVYDVLHTVCEGVFGHCDEDERAPSMMEGEEAMRGPGVQQSLDGMHCAPVSAVPRTMPAAFDLPTPTASPSPLSSASAFKIWGFTARLCIKVATVVLSRPPSFPLHPLTDPHL